MRVLLTGSAGIVGQVLVAGLKEKYALRGFDLKPTPGLEESVVGDLADFAVVVEATQGMDAVIHLADIGRADKGWPAILRNNIVATYNVFEAARQSGVRRIAYASRAGVLSPYPRQMKRTAEMFPLSDSYYTVSKVFGEQLGHMYSSRFGLEVVCVRVGNIRAEVMRPKGTPVSDIGSFFSHRDCVHLFERCLIQPAIKYEVVFGVSNNSPCRYDVEYARKALGYEPQDKMQDFIEKD